MFGSVLSLFLPFFIAASPPQPTIKPVNLEAVLDAVEHRYNDTKTLDATFEQSFRNKVFRRTQRSKGRVRFSRPGLMEWRYERPSKRRFVLDGKDLWIHQIDDGQIFVRRNYDGDDLKAALRFLWGDGSLRANYEISLIKANKERVLLKLVPKKPVGYYRFVRISVDRTSHRVTHSVVVDHRGNENRFAFREARYNTLLPADSFRFSKPDGARVTELTTGAK
jgi:outer membrane lipoprotein carrier protein